MAQKIVLVIGSVFGRLTVLEQAEPLTFRRGGTFGSTYEKHQAVCRCECGNTVIVRVDQMRSGKTRSCGCLREDKARERMSLGTVQRGNTNRRTHNKTNTPEFWAWETMKARCSNPKQRSYPHYGGRGITVCQRWLHSFENFLLDMGQRPSPKHSIDRIDNDGSYEPGNCRWTTMTEQCRNKSQNVLLTFRGETLCCAEWAERFNITRTTIWRRMQLGWDAEKILSRPRYRAERSDKNER